MLGLDLGARFLRGAICDLRGEVRARQDVELAGRRRRRARSTRSSSSATSLVEATGLAARADRRRRSSACPASSTRTAGGSSLATNVPGLEGRDFGGDARASGSGFRSPSRTTSTSPPSASSGGASRAGSTTSSSSRSAPASAPGSCCAASSTAAATAPPARSTSSRPGARDEIDPCAAAVSALAARLVAERTPRRRCAPPYDARGDLRRRPRRRRRSAREVVDEEARRIALHIAPIAAVTDVALVVLGGGIGANGDLLLDPIRGLLAEWLPYPPRVEVSSLGDAAVLTGALAVGLAIAQESVFANRGGAPAKATVG